MYFINWTLGLTKKKTNRIRCCLWLEKENITSGTVYGSICNGVVSTLPINIPLSLAVGDLWYDVLRNLQERMVLFNAVAYNNLAECIFKQ